MNGEKREWGETKQRREHKEGGEEETTKRFQDVIDDFTFHP